jgi:hypothetical protein
MSEHNDDYTNAFSKIIYQDAQEGLLAAFGNKLNTLVERTSDLTKSASNGAFGEADYEQHRPDKDHFLVHAVALGGWPTYPPNRNADAFPSSSLRDYHDTFVKYGHFFREHKHHDPETDGIGLIKASAYNAPLDRVELLIWGHKKKASDAYDMARSGKELSFSMSAKLKEDRCNICDNRENSPAAYCDHLQNHLGQYLPEHKKFAFAINDKPRFFDISQVVRPADRIAHYISYKFPSDENGELLKAASAGSIVIPSYELALMEGVRNSAPSVLSASTKRILTKLAAAEQWVQEVCLQEQSTPEWQYMFRVLADAYRDNDVEGITKLANLRPGTLFGEMGRAMAVLPPSVISTYIQEDIQPDALNGIHSEILKNASCCNMMEDLIPMFSGFGTAVSDIDPNKGDEVDDIMSEMSSKYSCKMEPVKNRAVTIIIKSGSVKGSNVMKKVASFDDKAEVYSAYQVAAFQDMVDSGFTDEDLLAKTFAAINYHRTTSV